MSLLWIGNRELSQKFELAVRCMGRCFGGCPSSTAVTQRTPWWAKLTRLTSVQRLLHVQGILLEHPLLSLCISPLLHVPARSSESHAPSQAATLGGSKGDTEGGDSSLQSMA